MFIEFLATEAGERFWVVMTLESEVLLCLVTKWDTSEQIFIPSHRMINSIINSIIKDTMKIPITTFPLQHLQ